MDGAGRRTVDATGAGDAFVGGFLAGLLAHSDAQRGIEQGIVAASFAIEDWGARGLLAATPEQACRDGKNGLVLTTQHDFEFHGHTAR